VLALSVGLMGCGEEGLFPTTVDPGPDFEVANVVFDEGFYYCQVEPRALFASSCSSGDPARGDGMGGCHSSVTSFTLLDYDLDPDPAVGPVHVADTCTGNQPGGQIPTEARDNYQSAQIRMRRNAESSPLLLRPLQVLKHPRKIFDDDSDAAAVIREWATRISTQ
jgi:hypothetical protein